MQKKHKALVKLNSEVIELLKRSRESVTSTVNDENQNCKKQKNGNSSVGMDFIKILDEKAEELINTAIKIYHQDECNGETFSTQEKFAYLTILKKIQDSKHWLERRVISNKQQLQCLLGMDIVKQEERKKLQIILEQWNDHKISKFPAKFRKNSCDDISNHYKNRLKLAGIEHNTLDTLLNKIKELSRAGGNETVVSTNLSDSGVSAKLEEQTFSSDSSLSSVVENCCRLCGDTTSQLVININKKNRSTDFKSLIEYFCHVEIACDDRLPQFVCINCKSTLDQFSRFANKVTAFQQELNDKLPSSTTATTAMHIKSEEDVYKECPITIDENFSPETPYDECESKAHDAFSTANVDTTVEDANLLTEEDMSMEINTHINSNFSLPTSPMCTPAVSGTVSPLFFLSTEPIEQQQPMQIANINMKATVKPCSISLDRLPIVFVPSDTESESEDGDDEEIFFEDLVLESSSPVRTPKFCVKTESVIQMATSQDESSTSDAFLINVDESC